MDSAGGAFEMHRKWHHRSQTDFAASPCVAPPRRGRVKCTLMRAMPSATALETLFAQSVSPQTLYQAVEEAGPLFPVLQLAFNIMSDRYANAAQVTASGSAAVANVEDLLNMGDDDFEGFEDIVDNSGDAGDISIVSTGTDEADNHFDAVIGALEDLIMEADFNALQSGFFRSHCSIFEDSEENKLEYTSIFQSYIDLIETYIERRLKEVFPGFEMDGFMQQLQHHEQEMEGSDVLEVLLSFGDFSTFKEIMLSYKTEMAGATFHVDVRSSVLHIPQMGFGGGMDESFEDPGTFDDDDDEEQGEVDNGENLEAKHAPDLSGLLSVSPLSLQGKGKASAAFQGLSVTGRHL